MKQRANFGSKIGVILASAGSAVGLGNIWRFPYETGQNGGAAFILIYFICILFFGLPVMISEFIIGRKARSNAVRAYKELTPGTPWIGIGILGILAGFLILSYYSVVAGWTLDYLFLAVSDNLSNIPEGNYTSAFESFISNPYRPIYWLILFIGLTHIIIVKGVRNGIEKSAKIMMPLLFLLLLVLAFRSISLPGGEKGIQFLLHPDFSKINSSVILSAMGQAFFSLSIGMGTLTTYASYFRKDTNLAATALEVTILDSFVAILAGLVIFPAVFSFGIDPREGPGLVFITLPNVFQHLPGTYIWSVLFYVLLVLAALTSTISIHEVITVFLNEEFNLSRKTAAYIVTISSVFTGIFCSLSFGELGNFQIGGLTIFGIFEFISSKILLPLGGMLISIFTGWFMQKRIVYMELTNNGSIKFSCFHVYIFILKYIAPLAIGVIFLNELGLF